MGKKIFIFLMLFSLVLALGCTKLGDLKDVGQTNQEGLIQKGTLNGTVIINGKPSTQLELISEQTGHVGFNLKNNGIREITNVTVTLLGCIQGESNDLGESVTILPNSGYYFNWNIQSPILGSTEIIRCPTTVRVCFNYLTKGRTDIVLIPENYREIPPSPNVATSGDFLNINYNFGVIRVINKTVNEIIGQMTVQNIGRGWIDYAGYSGTNLSINTIRQIKMSILETPGVEIIKYGELSAADLGPERLSVDKKTITINEKNAGEHMYMLRMTQGKELISRIVLGIPSPDKFQTKLEVGTLETEIEHGYCVDIATINTVLRGR